MMASAGPAIYGWASRQSCAAGVGMHRTYHAHCRMKVVLDVSTHMSLFAHSIHKLAVGSSMVFVAVKSLMLLLIAFVSVS